MPTMLEDRAHRNGKLEWAERQPGMGDAPWCLWTKAICWSNDNKTDGFIPSAVLGALTTHPEPSKVASVLCESGAFMFKSGLFVAVDGGYQIHDFEKHNFTKAQRESKLQKDRERKAKASGFQTDSTTTPRGIQTESKRNPPGIQEEAPRNPNGIQTESDGIPARVQTDSVRGVSARPDSFRADSACQDKARQDKSKLDRSAGAEGTETPPLPAALQPTNQLRRWDATATKATEADLRAIWCEAIGATQGRAYSLHAGFADQSQALADLWREATATAPGLTLEAFFNDLTAKGATPSEDGFLRAWGQHEARRPTHWKPTEFLAWRSKYGMAS